MDHGISLSANEGLWSDPEDNEHTSTITIEDVQIDDAGTYAVIIRSGAPGQVPFISDRVELTVQSGRALAGSGFFSRINLCLRDRGSESIDWLRPQGNRDATALWAKPK